MFTISRVRTLIALGAVAATVGSTAVASAATVGGTGPSRLRRSSSISR